MCGNRTRKICENVSNAKRNPPGRVSVYFTFACPPIPSVNWGQDWIYEVPTGADGPGTTLPSSPHPSLLPCCLSVNGYLDEHELSPLLYRLHMGWKGILTLRQQAEKAPTKCICSCRYIRVFPSL